MNCIESIMAQHNCNPSEAERIAKFRERGRKPRHVVIRENLERKLAQCMARCDEQGLDYDGEPEYEMIKKELLKVIQAAPA